MNVNPFKEVLLWLAIFPLIPSFILFLLGYLRYFKRRDWKKTEAVTVPNKRFGIGYPKPIVRYEVNGVVYEKQSKMGQKNYLPKKRRVKVFYNPDNPEEMIIDTFFQRGSALLLGGSVFLFFSITSIILGLIMQSILNFFT